MRKILLITFILTIYPLTAQRLSPGFEPKEYFDLLSLLAQNDESNTNHAPVIPASYTLAYQSPAMGFDNQWSLWINDQNQAVIAVRGSVSTKLSWLSNLYQALIPAKGHLTLSQTLAYDYHLSDNPQAAIHTGWLLSMGFLVPDIRTKIDSCYQQGIRDYYITGHSQGGAISYLLTSELKQQQKRGELPADLLFKTYASASPKPGNLSYAYDFETETQDGWAFHIINPLDWVPEMPFSIQTTKDFNLSNPFPMIENLMSQQSFAKRIVFRHFYHQIEIPPNKSQQKMEKILGKNIFKLIKKQLPELQEPKYVHSNNYARAGSSRILIPDANYFSLFPHDPHKPFTHHSYKAYLYLAELGCKPQPTP